MEFFAVHYTYSDDRELAATHRPAHRDFLRSLTASGLVAAGACPEAEPPGGLLIIRADSPEAVTRLLEDDPFRVEGVLVDSRIERWTPVIGVFAE